jgi:hypothetical protein
MKDVTSNKNVIVVFCCLWNPLSQDGAIPFTVEMMELSACSVLPLYLSPWEWWSSQLPLSCPCTFHRGNDGAVSFLCPALVPFTVGMMELSSSSVLPLYLSPWEWWSSHLPLSCPCTFHRGNDGAVSFLWPLVPFTVEMTELSSSSVLPLYLSPWEWWSSQLPLSCPCNFHRGNDGALSFLCPALVPFIVGMMELSASSVLPFNTTSVVHKLPRQPVKTPFPGIAQHFPKRK